MNNRPASVTAAIVVLTIMCLAALSVAVVPTADRQRPLSWFAASCGLILFGLPLFALAMRKSWGRIYVTVLFSLLAVGMVYVNATSANSQNLAFAVGYALVISGLLAWNVLSLWSEKATAYFANRDSGP